MHPLFWAENIVNQPQVQKRNRLFYAVMKNDISLSLLASNGLGFNVSGSERSASGVRLKFAFGNHGAFEMVLSLIYVELRV